MATFPSTQEKFISAREAGIDLNVTMNIFVKMLAKEVCLLRHDYHTNKKTLFALRVFNDLFSLAEQSSFSYVHSDRHRLNTLKGEFQYLKISD